MADSPSPSDDRDRDLAARIGVLREQGRPLDASALTEDAVIQALLAYRAEQDVTPSPERSERLWAAIEAETAAPDGAMQGETQNETQAEERGPARILTLPSAARWAVAASVALAAVVAWLVFTGAPEPVPVATATTQVETYTAPDGSTIRLRPHSTLSRIDVEGARRYRLTGEALFDVTTRPEPFVVEAGALRVQVLGTRFTAHTWGRPAVFLQEGRVQVSTDAAPEPVTLQPGQRSELTAAGALTAPVAADSLAALDWLRQEIVFEARPAGEVVAELEQHYGLTVTLPDAVAEEALTGSIALETPAQSLADLGLVLGGRFEPAGDAAYRFVPQGAAPTQE